MLPGKRDIAKIRESTFLDSVDRVVVGVGPRHRGQFPEHGVTT